MERPRRRHADGDELYGLIAGTLRRHPWQTKRSARRAGPISTDSSSATSRTRSRCPPCGFARLLQQQLAGCLPEDPAAAATAQRVGGDGTVSPEARPQPVRGGKIPREDTLERSREQTRTGTEIHKERFQALQRCEQDAWKAIYDTDTVKDFSRPKRLWMENLEDLAHERNARSQRSSIRPPRS